MELLAQIDRPRLSREQEEQAKRFAYQVFLQSPDDMAVIRASYEYYHQLMDRWITTGKRPDHEELEREWAPEASALILPFKRAGSA